MFYGWINIAVLWANYLLLMGGVTYTYGVTVSAMASALGMSMLTATGAYTCYMLCSGFLSPVLGRLIQRLGVKRCMLLGSGAGSAGSALMAFAVNGPVLYYLVWTLTISVMICFGVSVPSQIVISNWFFRLRGRAMAIYLTAGGFGGLLFAPLVSRVVAAAGNWRAAWLVMLGACCLSFLLVALLLKEAPQHPGDQPDGGAQAAGRSPRACAFKTTQPWTLKRAVRSRAFFCIIYCQICLGFVMNSITNQMVGYLTGRGVGAAAAVLGFFSFCSIGGRILTGALADRIDPRRTTWIGILALAAGMLLLGRVDQEAGAYLAAAVLGCSFGLCFSGVPNILANYFGTHDYARIVVRYTLITSPCSALSAALGGLIVDLTGGPGPIWGMLAVLLGIAAILLGRLRPPRLA